MSWDIFSSFEEILLRTDCIVIATVETTKTERIFQYNRDTLTRFTTLRVNEIVKSDKTLEKGDMLTLETYEGMYNGNTFIEPTYCTPVLSPEKEVMLFLTAQDKNYRLVYEAFGKFDIINGKVEGCSVSKNEFISEILDVIEHRKNTFDLNHPDVYMNTLVTAKGASKVASTVTLPSSDFQFRNKNEFGYDDLPIKIRYYINPTNGKDINGNNINLDSLEAYVNNACNLWNAVSNSAIEFSVVIDSTVTLTENSGDNWSVISFGSVSPGDAHEIGPYAISGTDYYESDITLKSSLNWRYAAIADSQSLERTIVHEMGHAAGIGDMGNGCVCPHYDSSSYNSNVMWHSSNYCVWTVDAPSTGDKLGTVYAAPELSGTLSVYTKILLCDARITDDFTIPSGKTVIVNTAIPGNHNVISVNASKRINVYGTLQFNEYCDIDKAQANNWSGIDLESGGVIDVDGYSTIQYAFNGINMYDNDGLQVQSGKRLVILNCSDYGIFSSASGTDFSGVFVNNCGDAAGESGIHINASGACRIDSVTVLNSRVGLYVAGSADLQVSKTDLRNDNVGSSIVVNYADLDLDSLTNSIYPKSGQYAVWLFAGANNVGARANYWGTSSPTDALFNSPDKVDYSGYLTSKPSGVGAPKMVVNLIADAFTNARALEERGNWQGAISKYHDILAGSADPGGIKRAIQRLIRAHDRSDRDFTDARAALAEHIPRMTGWLRPALELESCDLYAREGKYDKAVAAFLAGADKYRGTSFEVEMLARAALLAVNELHDKVRAKEYADRAAVLNPGQRILYGVYWALDTYYDPLCLYGQI